MFSNSSSLESSRLEVVDPSFDSRVEFTAESGVDRIVTRPADPAEVLEEV